jgi:death-on-curing protein
VTRWVWIESRDVLLFHARLLAVHGGAVGIRDESLLESALARPQHRIAYGEKVDPCELAATYAAGIIRNHPFVDGNKRTGFLIGILFLELNGHRFTAQEAEATRAVIELASGTISESDYAAFLRANTVTA